MRIRCCVTKILKNFSDCKLGVINGNSKTLEVLQCPSILFTMRSLHFWPCQRDSSYFYFCPLLPPFFLLFSLFRELPVVLGYFSGGENGPPLCLSTQPKCKISKKEREMSWKLKLPFSSLCLSGGSLWNFRKSTWHGFIGVAWLWVIGLCGYTFWIFSNMLQCVWRC